MPLYINVYHRASRLLPRLADAMLYGLHEERMTASSRHFRGRQFRQSLFITRLFS